ncbi:hypothetical protein Ciccas_009214 [Cichlidogyrus casuarinus]|uniref:Ubiquitin-like modifier-activating enzyme Atg7 N-terminal domain-containing protein n=1 Tax=Cichlidogyrus casuarinus TaxID=1844966 RepID=A0ABD2PXQ7_9PLAT
MRINSILSPFFVLRKSSNGLNLMPFDQFTFDKEELFLVFCDPSTSDRYPGWPLRNQLYALSST